MEVVVRPIGRVISAEPGANLLDTLRKNDIPISYSCMSGRCGICRCKVVEGEVLTANGELRQPFLNEDTHVLACQSTLTSGCAIEIPEPDEIVCCPAKILKAKVAEIRQETHDIRSLKVKANKPLEYVPGQYATLEFGPDLIRPYSMAGIMQDDLLEFHVRLVPGGRVSPYVFDTLKEGDSLRLSGPLGASYLRRRHRGPMLLVAGGTGLAPALSLLRGALAVGMDNPIHLYFGARTVNDLYCTDRLAALAAANPQVALHLVVSNGTTPAGIRSGLVTEAIEQDWQDLSAFRAYLCGAPAMVEAATLSVKRRGVSLSHIYADAFYSTGY
ncbi:2Fe-2S iron-sulfur cluster-binding protein [Xanthobacter flavus]|uniref:2Fe-2S iron-sulfur cluster-binding protein n=1 Tax=Xanthobacter flavus TaxID=281 RepID=UPI00372C8597